MANMTTVDERTKVIAQNFEGWSDELKQEVTKPSFNLGSTIIYQNDNVRIWTIVLKPHDRLPFHRHRLPYLWVIHSDGHALSHFDTGETKEIHYKVNDSKMPMTPNGPDKSFTHDLVNIGNTDLHFTTVEFLNSG